MLREEMSRYFVDVYHFKKFERTVSISYQFIHSYFPSLFILILYKLIIYLHLFLFLTLFHWILKRKLRIIRIIWILLKEWSIQLILCEIQVVKKYVCNILGGKYCNKKLWNNIQEII